MSRVAVIGASSNRGKFGNKAVRAYLKRGYEVFPVHPAQSAVEGLSCVPSIGMLASDLDIVSVYVAPSVLVGLLPEIAEKGCGELWLNPGTESPDVLERAKELGLNVIQGCSIVSLGFSPSQFP